MRMRMRMRMRRGTCAARPTRTHTHTHARTHTHAERERERAITQRERNAFLRTKEWRKDIDKTKTHFYLIIGEKEKRHLNTRSHIIKVRAHALLLCREETKRGYAQSRRSSALFFFFVVVFFFFCIYPQKKVVVRCCSCTKGSFALKTFAKTFTKTCCLR